MDTLQSMLTIPSARRKRVRLVRDGQQRKLYTAESRVFDGWRNKTDLTQTTQCEVWIGRVLKSERARKAVVAAGGRWPARVTIKSQGRGAHAKPHYQEISIAPNMRKEWVLLHELAHVCTKDVGLEVAGHGREYAAIYVALVGAVLGKSWADRLKREFRTSGVKFKPKRTLSPERKAALVARMAAMRAKAKAIKAMSDDDYLEHNASKNDGAINIDDPRALDIVVRQQNEAASKVTPGHEPAERSAAGHGTDDGSTHPKASRVDDSTHQRAMSIALALSEM